MKINLSELKEKTGIGFGTSGVRGLATSLTDEIVYAYTLGFLDYLKSIGDVKDKVAIAGDLRESTDRIMSVVAKAIEDSGLEVINCGKIPTPAVIFYGIKKEIPSIMVTGSHIPADRNGIKFNKSTGEILKSDETAILEREVSWETKNHRTELPEVEKEAEKIYIDRYSQMFGQEILEGMKIGVYQHSAVGREIVAKVLENLGAVVTRLKPSDTFIALDTEVITEELKFKGKELNGNGEFEALISTDGDSDRPLLGNNQGEWLRSDILGILAAKFLGMEVVVVPVSTTTAVEKSGYFKIEKTKIGSPYVIAKMMEYFGKNRVAGFEGNGGFFTEELPTRDALTPLLCWLVMAKKENKSIWELKELLPKRFSQSNSIKDFPTEISLKLLSKNKEKVLEELKTIDDEIKEIDETDGLRVTFVNDEIIHLRPSMNSPEFRNYVEADNEIRANHLSEIVTKLIASWQK